MILPVMMKKQRKTKLPGKNNRSFSPAMEIFSGHLPLSDLIFQIQIQNMAFLS